MQDAIIPNTLEFNVVVNEESDFVPGQATRESSSQAVQQRLQLKHCAGNSQPTHNITMGCEFPEVVESTTYLFQVPVYPDAGVAHLELDLKIDNHNIDHIHHTRSSLASTTSADRHRIAAAASPRLTSHSRRCDFHHPLDMVDTETVQTLAGQLAGRHRCGPSPPQGKGQLPLATDLFDERPSNKQQSPVPS